MEDLIARLTGLINRAPTRGSHGVKISTIIDVGLCLFNLRKSKTCRNIRREYV